MSRHLSRFAHLIHIREDVYALWNALWLRTVFLTEPFVSLLRSVLRDGNTLPCGITDVAPNVWEQFIAVLGNEHFLSPASDAEKLVALRHAMEQEKISLMYLILSQTCNQRCDYCYLTQMLEHGGSCNLQFMSADTIVHAINYFKRVLGPNAPSPQIVLYGGEPTLNPALGLALKCATEQIPNVELVLVTNGTAITPEIAKLLAQYKVNVGVSIDGPAVIHNLHRVFPDGGGTFEQAKKGYALLQEAGANVGISCTITQTSAPMLEKLFRWFLGDFGTRGIDFNVLLDDEGGDYATHVAQGLVSCFVCARNNGIHLDRVMRRVKPFSEGNVVFHDCGAAGNQIVITPDKRIGLCQGFLNTGEFFFPWEEVPDPEQHPLWQQWKTRSPFNIDKCLSCEALGICGGGCFYGPYQRTGNIMIVDETNCAHVKATLQFLLEDLYEKQSE